jgi:hypothetical protein
MQFSPSQTHCTAAELRQKLCSLASNASGKQLKWLPAAYETQFSSLLPERHTVTEQCRGSNRLDDKARVLQDALFSRNSIVSFQGAERQWIDKLLALATVISKALRDCLAHRLHNVDTALDALKDAYTKEERNKAAEELVSLTWTASTGSDWIVSLGRIFLHPLELQERYNASLKALLTEMLELEALGLVRYGHSECKMPVAGIYCLTSQSDNLGADLAVHDTDFWLVALCHEAIRRNNPGFVHNNCFVLPFNPEDSDATDSTMSTPTVSDFVVTRLVEGLHCTVAKKACLIWTGAMRLVHHVLKDKNVPTDAPLLTAGRYATLCDIKRHQAVDACISWLTARRQPRLTEDARVKDCDDNDSTSSSTDPVNSSPLRETNSADAAPLVSPKIVLPYLEAGGSAKLNGFLASTFDSEDAWTRTGRVRCTEEFRQLCSRSHKALCERLCKLDFDIGVAKQHAQLVAKCTERFQIADSDTARLVRVVKSKEQHSHDNGIFLSGADCTLYASTASRVRYGTHLLGARPSWLERRVRFSEGCWNDKSALDWVATFGEDCLSGTHGCPKALQMWEAERDILVRDVEEVVSMRFAEDQSVIQTELKLVEGLIQSSTSHNETLSQTNLEIDARLVQNMQEIISFAWDASFQGRTHSVFEDVHPHKRASFVLEALSIANHVQSQPSGYIVTERQGNAPLLNTGWHDQHWPAFCALAEAAHRWRHLTENVRAFDSFLEAAHGSAVVMGDDGALTVDQERADALVPSIEHYLFEMTNRYGETRPTSLYDILNATDSQAVSLGATMAPFVSWLPKRFARLLRPGLAQKDYPVLPRFGIVSKPLAEEATRLLATGAPSRLHEIAEASSATFAAVLFSKRGIKRRQREHEDVDSAACYRSIGSCQEEDTVEEESMTFEELFGSDSDEC